MNQLSLRLGLSKLKTFVPGEESMLLLCASKGSSVSLAASTHTELPSVACRAHTASPISPTAMPESPCSVLFMSEAKRALWVLPSFLDQGDPVSLVLASAAPLWMFYRGSVNRLSPASSSLEIPS